MGCLIEFIVEIVFGSMIEGYFYLMTLIAPERSPNQKTRNAIMVFATAIAGILFVVLFIGIFISLSDDAYTKMIGRYMVFIPLAIILIQILLGIILRLIVKRKK